MILINKQKIEFCKDQKFIVLLIQKCIKYQTIIIEKFQQLERGKS